MLDIYGTLEIKPILEEIALLAHSEKAKNILLSLKMNQDIALLKQSLCEVEEMMSLILRHSNLPIHFSKDLTASIQMVNKGGVLTATELDQIANDIRVGNEILMYFGRVEKHLYPSLFKIKDRIEDLSILEEKIRRVVKENLSIADDASPKLKKIRHSINDLQGEVRDLSRSLISKYSDFLSENTVTVRNDHFVLPVKTANKNKVPGIIHDISDTGLTTFIEPSILVELSNKIYSLHIEEKEEIYRLLQELSKEVLKVSPNIESNNDIIALLDFISAKATYGNGHNCVVGKIVEERLIEIHGARHPLIASDKVIENDFTLNENQRIIIISGPNAGGKTVALKTLGLLVMMNQMAIPIPAKSPAIFGYFPRIYADIGDNQSLLDNLSTFAAHISNLSTITHFVTSKDLVLLDELGTGTSPLEGEALALSVTRYLLSKKCFAIISSHFEKMKELAYSTKHITNAMMIFDEKELLPTYQLKIGYPGRSYGFEMAKRYHLNEEIIDEAKDYLKNAKHHEINDVLDQLNATLAKNELESKNLAEKARKLDVREHNISLHEERLQERKESLLKDVEEEQSRIINEARTKVNVILRNLDKDNLKIHEIISAKTELNKLEESSVSESTTYHDEIKLNDYVEIPSLGIIGKVTSLKGESIGIVTNDGLSVKSKIDQVRLYDGIAPSSPKVNKIDESKLLKTDIKLELNIIGYHIDEGIESLAKYLDDCRIRHFKVVRIIHGMGTGQLRAAVHQYLKKCDFIEEFHYGGTYDGGTGATIVTFK